jgi:hypothetical protein
LVSKGDVEKSGTSNFDCGAHGRDIAERFDNFSRHIARIPTERLSQRQNSIGLGIGMVTRPNDGIETALSRDLVEGHLQPGDQKSEGIKHALPLLPKTLTAQWVLSRHVTEYSGGMVRHLHR